MIRNGSINLFIIVSSTKSVMRLSELDFQNSILILENIKQKLRGVKQGKFTLPEGEYKEFKADMVIIQLYLEISRRKSNDN